MGLEKQGAKPSGFVGRIIGKMMNKFHTGKYIRYFQNNLPQDNSAILDIGCGGGKFIKHLNSKNPTYKLFGLDHSTEMIKMSRKLNQKGILNDQVEIVEGSAMEIPLEDNSIDLVTAFETVHFWPDIQKSFKEVIRVLKPGGAFLIINIYPKEDTKWWHLAQMKSDKEFTEKYIEAGFKDIQIDLDFHKGWIFINGLKP
jgi:ubiquinone/menaquinone biosynthesis C-methylase UbiE